MILFTSFDDVYRNMIVNESLVEDVDEYIEGISNDNFSQIYSCVKVDSVTLFLSHYHHRIFYRRVSNVIC